MKIYVFYLIICFSLISCMNKNTGNKREVIGKINGEEIYASEIDKLIKQELFDQLNQIYNIRNKAFDAYINTKVLQKEAELYNLTFDEYSKKYVLQKIQTVGVDSLYNQYKLDQRVRLHGLNISRMDKNSLEEKLSSEYYLKSLIIQTLIDSLKQNVKIEKYIFPPKSPTIDLSDLLSYSRGKEDSKVTVTIISDFDCNKCIETHPLFDSLYFKYSNEVKFTYINFSATPTLAQLACNAAHEQGKFWTYHDSLYHQRKFIDSLTVYNLARQIGLDIPKFTKDLLNPQAAHRINETIHKLVQKGIFATPTVIVNKRFIYNSNSFEEISYLIEKELNR